MIFLKFNAQEAAIDAGELVGYKVNGQEYIHQKGSPGWRNSDTEMFPLIGPTAAARFRVQTPKGPAVQDQHGLLRELRYELLEQAEDKAVFLKKYTAGTPIKNAKFPVKSTEPLLSWPYDFEFRKTFSLSETGLQLIFEVSGTEGMPFMLGYHPAFKLISDQVSIQTGERTISLQEVLAVGSRALPVMDCTSLLLSDDKAVRVQTKGFGHFMLWTEVPNMICIEPITFYPYAVSEEDLHTGFQHLGTSPKSFEVLIQVVSGE